MILTVVIDVEEEQDVAIEDIPGAFLQSKMTNFVTMVLQGKLANIMVSITPKVYGPYLMKDKNGKSSIQKIKVGII